MRVRESSATLPGVQVSAGVNLASPEQACGIPQASVVHSVLVESQGLVTPGSDAGAGPPTGHV